MTESTMLAGRMDYATGRFSLHDTARPSPAHGEVLVRVRAAGICLSDVHLIDGSISPPLRTADVVTLGHEIAGEVACLGAGDHAFSVGDRVVVSGGRKVDGNELGFGIDIDGGWAEYVVTPADALTPLPEGISYEQAAIVPDAVTTPWEAITRTARVKPGEAVGVWGIGGLGLHAIQLLRSFGAAPVIAIDPSQTARKRAADAGADAAIDPGDPQFEELLSASTLGRGLDVALDFAGVPDVRRQSLVSLADGGRLVLVGISGQPITIDDEIDLIFRQLSILGHYGSDSGSVAEVLRLVEIGRLDLSRSVTATLPLNEAERGVEMLRDKVGEPIRLVLLP